MSELRFNLDLIEVLSPCTVPWETMQGSDRVRHCGQCNQNVYHLSVMTREEAEKLIHQKEGKLCVQFFRRPDGTIVTRDCVAVRWSRAVWRAGSFAFVGTMSVLFGPWLLATFQKWEGIGDKPTRTAGIPAEHWRELQRNPRLEIAPPPHDAPTPE